MGRRGVAFAVTFRLGMALAVLLVLAGGILLLRPGPMPEPQELDVLSSLVTQFVGPLGDVAVASAASDCRTDGETRAVLPAALFQAFLAANAEAESFDLAPFRHRVRVLPPGVDAGSSRTVVSLSRAGLLGNDALVCVEVFGREERAFFVVLQRDHDGVWSVTRELTAWEPPEDPDTGASAADDEPLFLPRPSQLEREARER